MSLFTPTFWADAFERAVKTVAQVILTLWGASDGLFNILTIDWKGTIGVAIGGGVLSLLMSIASAATTRTASASLTVDAVPKE